MENVNLTKNQKKDNLYLFGLSYKYNMENRAKKVVPMTLDLSTWRCLASILNNEIYASNYVN